MNKLSLPTRIIEISAKTISLDDIKNIYSRLLENVISQGERELAKQIKPENLSDDEFEEQKQQVRDLAFKITITISGGDSVSNQTSIYGDDQDIFDSNDLPEPISYIYMTNITAFQNFTQNDREPSESFELNIDFSKPALIDNNNPVSDPTPNNTKLFIKGQNSAWLGAIEEAVVGVLKNKGNHRSFLHRAYVYDLGLWLVILPIAIFYFCVQAKVYIINFFGYLDDLIIATMYLYIIFLVMWAYRILFGYTKWAFPTIELKENSDRVQKHRNFWYAIMVSLVGSTLFKILS